MVTRQGDASRDSRSYRRGRVAAIGTNRHTVSIDGGTLSLPFLGSGYAVDDVVMVATNGLGQQNGSGDWIIVGKQGTYTPPAPPPTQAPPPPAVNYYTASVVPVSTGSYRGGWRSDTSDLFQGDYTGRGINTGAAFYGDQIVGLGANLAWPVGITLTTQRIGGGSFASVSPTLITIGDRYPAGAPSGLASTAGVGLTIGATGTQLLPGSVTTGAPTGMVLALMNGTAGGLGIYVASTTPYCGWAGLGTWGAAMSLSISYYR